MMWVIKADRCFYFWKSILRGIYSSCRNLVRIKTDIYAAAKIQRSIGKMHYYLVTNRRGEQGKSWHLESWHQVFYFSSYGILMYRENADRFK
mmetsp:Transcript_15356/g.31157  ORF Transcript_15356/g.31157 Transcript_15356/m.31157 type:complete len:92 (-) Transcript_15356:57-332(-)